MATSVPKKLLAIPMMALPLLLMSCGDKLPVKATKPPVDLLSCADEPLSPVLTPYEWDRVLQSPTVQAAVDMMRAITGKRDGATLSYVLAMRAAYGDCASKVAGVRSWAEQLPGQ